jgi:hypothetical protein
MIGLRDEALRDVLEAMEKQGYVTPKRREWPVIMGCVKKIESRIVQEKPTA